MGSDEGTRKEKPWLFQKGKSGNPSGRPKKGNTFGEIIEAELEKWTGEAVASDGTARKLAGKELLAYTLVKVAMKADNTHHRVIAIDKIIDRIDGKAIESIRAVVQQSTSVFDEIDVSKLTSKQKRALEDILNTLDGEGELTESEN